MAKRTSWAVEGQLNLFEYMATLEQMKKAENVLSYKDKKAKILSSAEEYLQKGERLTSLAKEKYGMMLKRLSFSDIEKKLFTIKIDSYWLYGSLVPKIATSVIRPLMRSLTTFDENDEALKIIKSLVDYDINLFKVEPNSYIGAVRALRYRRHVTDIIGLTIKEDRYNPSQIYGPQSKALAKNQKDRLFSDGSVQGDIAEVIAWLVCFTQYNRALNNEELRPALQEILYAGDNSKWLMTAAVLGVGCVGWNKDCKDVHELFEKHNAPITLPVHKYRHPSETAVNEFCKTIGYDPDRIIKDNNDSEKCLHDRNRLQIRADGSPYLYVLNSDLDLAFHLVDPFNWVKTERGKLCYHDFLGYSEKETINHLKDTPEYIPNFWCTPSGNNGIRSEVLSNMEKVMKLVFENYKEKVITLNYLRDNKSRASVFQTKKNIPAKTIKEMQESSFNDYFGYVEFDEEVDLEKVGLIADQFIAFKETYLKALDTKKVSIRFRKLGNYKAAGLYFPHIGCLCVDFRYPDSLVHEYGHCIDNVMGDNGRQLSDMDDFYSTYAAYRRAFISALSKSGKTLSGKYNADYYLRKTEVFARCMEMYVVRTLGVNNSICKPDDETAFAYPQDEELMKKINEYFVALFNELNEDKEVAAA